MRERMHHGDAMWKMLQRWDRRLLDDHPLASWIIAPFGVLPIYAGVLHLVACPFEGIGCGVRERAWGIIPLGLGFAIVGCAIALWLRARRARKEP